MGKLTLDGWDHANRYRSVEIHLDVEIHRRVPIVASGVNDISRARPGSLFSGATVRGLSCTKVRFETHSHAWHFKRRAFVVAAGARPEVSP
jgi:hypothetical protein